MSATLTTSTLTEMISKAASIIAPVWPLKTFIACNPLQGFEDLDFEAAVAKAEAYQKINQPIELGREAVNREMIKWLSAFLDDGQATIPMPKRVQGFYRTFMELAQFDSHLTHNKTLQAWLTHLPQSPEEAIAESFKRLNLVESEYEEFMRQSLIALPGWSGYVKWNSDWRHDENKDNPINIKEYLAVRLIITCVLWPRARVFELKPVHTNFLGSIFTAEKKYQQALLKALLPEAKKLSLIKKNRPLAQLVFCIDVRSEPFRRALETRGQYETFGFAGFFGLPVSIRAYGATESYPSCPVLLKPVYEISEHPDVHSQKCLKHHERGKRLVKAPGAFYRTLKYNFATPFALAEMIGPWLGLRSLVRTFMPAITSRIKEHLSKILIPNITTLSVLDNMNLQEQANYAEAALRIMGLTQHLAPLVVFCGHGSTTRNNAYASALDCGACGGNPGGSNARIFAAILNQKQIRSILSTRGINIPQDTLFIAAQHDTTTDEVELYLNHPLEQQHQALVDKVKQDLDEASLINALARSVPFKLKQQKKALKASFRRSEDWAQPRPEWGLARNAAFIVGPRQLTQHINLEGRCFLHSYDWQTDTEGKFLQIILTAPMVVAQWINHQYLFSTLDNVAYGAGSKITKNVTGKIGVMQGNGSDLMHGLPLQSVYASDNQAYHEPLRLLTIVYAPRQIITELINKNPALQKLFGNGWVRLACIEPKENKIYLLDRNMRWEIGD